MIINAAFAAGFDIYFWSSSAIVALLKSINTMTTSISVCELGVFGGGGEEKSSTSRDPIGFGCGWPNYKTLCGHIQLNRDAII